MEHGVHVPEAVAWRSNAAWLAWASVRLEFLAQSSLRFPAIGPGQRDWKSVVPQLIVKHRGRESRTMSARAQPGMVRAGHSKD